MVALSLRRSRLLAGLLCSVAAAAAVMHGVIPAGGQAADEQPRRMVRLSDRHQVMLAGFALPQQLPRLEGPSLSAIQVPSLDQSMIIPPRSQNMFVKAAPVANGPDLLTRQRLGVAAAERWHDAPWADPVTRSDLRLATDSREVRLASLAVSGLNEGDSLLSPTAEALASIEQTYVEIRGISAVAAAGAGVGAPAIPLSEEPYRLLSGMAKGDNPGLNIGTPPSAALAGANPDVSSHATPALALALQGEDNMRQRKCLADAVYWEARSEPRNGQIAVAQVVVNRALSGFYPKDLCGVVYQNAHRYLSCQFTFACEGRRSLVPTEVEYWQQAQTIADDMLSGKIWLSEVGNATHYHADYVRPWWARKMNKIKTIGAHSFYRPRNWS